MPPGAIPRQAHGSAQNTVPVADKPSANPAAQNHLIDLTKNKKRPGRAPRPQNPAQAAPEGNTEESAYSGVGLGARSCQANCEPPSGRARRRCRGRRTAVCESPARSSAATTPAKSAQKPGRMSPTILPGFCFEDAKRALHVFTHTAPRMFAVHSCNADRLQNTARHIFPGPFSTAGSPAAGPCPLLYRAGEMLYNVVARCGT